MMKAELCGQHSELQHILKYSWSTCLEAPQGLDKYRRRYSDRMADLSQAWVFQGLEKYIL